jgi:hypothetical protein
LQQIGGDDCWMGDKSGVNPCNTGIIRESPDSSCCAVAKTHGSDFLSTSIFPQVSNGTVDEIQKRQYPTFA